MRTKGTVLYYQVGRLFSRGGGGGGGGVMKMFGCYRGIISIFIEAWGGHDFC